MKSPFLARAPLGVLLSVLAFTGIAASGIAPISSPTAEASRAALDRALAADGGQSRLVRLGDMLLPRDFVRAARDRLARPAGAPTDSAFAGGVTLWPGGVVPYAFAGDVTVNHQRAFIDAANDWSAFAAVTFVPRTTEADYVLVQNMASGGGLSAVGKVGGAQTFMIGPSGWNRGTLNHEIGHALGLIHEHQRSDRDSYVVLFPQNLPGGQLDGNYVLLPSSDNQGAYDFLSVMHYSRNQFSTNGQDTMQPRPAYAQFLDAMGNNPDRPLSALDRQKMAAKYGPGPALTGVVRNTRDSGPDSLRAAIYYAVDHPGTTITFAIPATDPGLSGGVYSIQPSDVMTRLGANTTIDGATQPSSNPNGPSVALSGAFVRQEGLPAPGLRLTEAGCTVRGLVIGGFSTYGIEITGSAATGNVVAGCYLGTDASGAAENANAFAGVGITAGAHGNTIGGTSAAARNVISGNLNQGVVITGVGTTANAVLGNSIGLNAAGTASLSSQGVGVALFQGASGNQVGAAAPGAGNVISGHVAQGVTISEPGTNANVVQGNRIGTNPAGSVARPNGQGGIAVFGGAQNSVIGGGAPGAGNLVSGNVDDGIFAGYDGTTGTRIQGNLVGTDITGAAALPNTGVGVTLYSGAASSLVGGTSAGEANVISGNGRDGVFIGFGAATTGNVVAGNLIGVNRAGTGALPNGGPGVTLYSGPQGNTIGGTAPGAGNVISGNAGDGVYLGFAGTNGNTVAGNRIGLDASGLAALPNGGAGVLLYDGPQGNVIGGGVGARNFIAGNTGNGVVLALAGTSGNSVRGNLLGLNAAGAARANGGSGIQVFGGAQNNEIGGAGLGEGNTIAGNGFDGVALYDGATTGNVLRRNSIRGNANRGIELVNGANLGRAAPVLSAATLGLGTSVQGTLAGANGSIRVEFFATPPAETAGGAGKYFVGEATPSASPFGVLLPAKVPAGHAITATATDAAGNTSEFSLAITVTTTDSDGDGLPNVWESVNGLNPNSAADVSGDRDGDGLSNLAEFRAGFDPNDPKSRLSLGIMRVGSDVQLSLPTVSGIQYVIQSSRTLADAWTDLASPISGSGGTVLVTDRLGAAGAKQFYRVVVVP